MSFVLVAPKEPGNIGSSARAIRNMGFRTLELVNPCGFLSGDARKMAHNAVDILERAVAHTDLRDAIRDKCLVAGTTRRTGRHRGLVLPLKTAAEKIIPKAGKNKVAILFGREDKGLKNKEAEECDFLITIPTDSRSPSLNLSQSVMLVAYELGQASYKADPRALIARKEMEELFGHVRSTLRLLDYVPRGKRDIEEKIMRNLRHLIGKTGLTEWELKMLRGLCAQVEKKLRG